MSEDSQGDERLVSVGSHGEYQWLTSSEAYLGTFVRLCPEAVLGRYLA